MDTTDMIKWHFAVDNDKLIELVLCGLKTATTGLYDENEILPQIGEMSVITFDNEKLACIVKTKKVIVTEFKNVTDEIAYLEGEGNRTLEYYRNEHINLFKKYNSNFNENTKVVIEIFELVEDLIKTRLNIAKKIVDNNLDIFHKINHNIVEINAGFNNDVFDVDKKFIIKVCKNKEKENEFEKEVNYYDLNKNSKYLAKLYKYDNSKEIIPFVYEIIEKINGNSLYYYWYKMNENERENTIKKLVEILKDVHQPSNQTYNWCDYVKKEVKICYEKVKNYFNEDNRKIIENSLYFFDKYLQDNNFACIHNDLHFDNVLLDGDKMYIIDFNDCMIAPIDYDLRQLFMCKDIPWKWANIEMDPFQKKEHYQNIDIYLKKYYKKLSDIKYLDERMIIYRILNDISLLTRFNNEELKESVIDYSNRLIMKNKEEECINI